MVLADSYRLSLAPYYLGYLQESFCFRLQDYHLLWFSFPENSANKMISYSSTVLRSSQKVPQHQRHNGRNLYCVVRFRLFPFRSPLLRKSIFLSLPWVTEMFHFSQLAHMRLCIQRTVSRHYSGWVAPFGNLRVKGCFRLSEAYRR
jgi:hypothetical protein